MSSDFILGKEGFQELHDRAEIIISTNCGSTEQGKDSYVGVVAAAKALQEQIEAAIENGTEVLYFTEDEVAFLAEVFS